MLVERTRAFDRVPFPGDKTPMSLQSQLLIAAPALRDPNFRQTVILLLQHRDDGAFGLVLNRPSSTPLERVWTQVSDAPCQRADPLMVGGPVEGPLMALHTLAGLSEIEVLPGLHFCAEPDKLRQLVAEHDGPARFFVGYAGWGAGQLESELKEGAWLTTGAATAHVFDADDQLWVRVNREIAGSTVIRTLGIKHVPPDPSLN